MAEDKQTSSVESANASTDATAGTGENKEVHSPQVNDAGTTDSGQSQQAETDKKYAGLDLDKIPEDARAEVQAWAEKRERDQMRYVTQKSQENADFKKKAQYYDEYANSQEYKDFKSWHGNKGAAPVTPQTPQTDGTTDFTTAGFSQEESSAISNAVERAVSRAVQQKEQQFTQQLGTIKQESAQTRGRQELIELAKLHPDIYDMADAGMLKPFVDHYCARQGQPLEVAYEKCKEAMDKLQKQGQQILSKRVKEKKEGVTATPSTVAGDQTVIYVEPGATPQLTQKRVDDLAFKLASEGKKVRVRVKKA